MAKTGRTVSQERSEARTEQLLDVAAKFFLEKGFAGASVSQIARQAHASKETFYSRYPTKEDLFRAVIRRQTDFMAAQMDALFVTGAPTEETLIAFGAVMVERLVSENTITLHRTIALDSRRFPELARIFFELGPARVIARLSLYLGEQMAQGKLRNVDPVAAAQQFLGLLTAETMMRRTLGIAPLPTGEELHSKVRSAVDVFLHGYAA